MNAIGQALSALKRAGGARAALAGSFALLGLYYYSTVLSESYPLEEWLAWRFLPIWGLTALFVTACLAFGHLLLWRVLRLRALPRLESSLFAFTLGVVSFTCCLFLLGAVGGFRRWPMFALAALFVLSGGPDLSRALRRPPRAPSAPMSLTLKLTWLAATLLGGVGLFLLYLPLVTPEAINFDANWYHLPIAQDYARAHRIVPFFGDVNRAFPHLNSLIYTWGFSAAPDLLPDQKWILALHLEFVFVLGKVVGAAAAARYLLAGKSVPGLWVAFFLFPSLFVYDQNPGGSSDHFLGFFAAPVLLAAFRTSARFSWRYAALLGVTLGGAMLTKYQAIYLLAVALALFVPRGLRVVTRATLRRLKRSNSPRGDAPQRGDVPQGDVPQGDVPQGDVPQGDVPPGDVPRGTGARRTRLGVKRVLYASLACALVALITSAPHFIKNTIYYKNPVYPQAMSLFKGSTPQHEETRLFLKHVYPTPHAVPPDEGLVERQISSFKKFFEFSFVPSYSLTKNVPSMGSLFTLLLPCLLFIRGRRKIALSVWAAFAGMWVWSNTYIGDRYLQALVPLFVAVTAALLVRTWELGSLARLGLVPLVLFQLIWSGDIPFYSAHRRLRASVDLIRSGYDKKREDHRRFRYRNAHKSITRDTPEDARIVTRNYRTTLGIDRDILFDIQAWQSQLHYTPMKHPSVLHRELLRLEVTHMLWPRGQRPPNTLQNTVLFAAVARDFGTHSKNYGSLTLVTLDQTERPIVNEPYYVALIGLRSYTDGLYRVEQLIRQPRLPKEKNRPQKPQLRLGRGRDDAIFKRASALVLGTPQRSRKPATPKFVEVERFKSFTLYLRSPDAAGAAAADDEAKDPATQGMPAAEADAASPEARDAGVDDDSEADEGAEPQSDAGDDDDAGADGGGEAQAGDDDDAE